jgi:hypothetical protein
MHLASLPSRGKDLASLLSRGNYCYYCNQSEPDPNNKTRFRVSYVFSSEQGHFPTGGGQTAPWYWDEDTCARKNKDLGLSEDDVMDIIAHSMFKPGS